MPVPIDAGQSAQQLFVKAQAAWSARVTPRFESFVLPCAKTFLESRCPPNTDVEFVVRLSDGRTYAQTEPVDGAAPLPLMHGGYIAGPDGAPLGFYRRLPDSAMPQSAAPPDLANDPLRTIATVSAADVAYRITHCRRRDDRRRRVGASRPETVARSGRVSVARPMDCA